MIKISWTAALLLSALASSARAAVAPVRFPAIAPLSAPLPLLSIAPSPLLPAPMLPPPSLPVSGPKILPGAWNQLPAALPVEAAASVPVHEEYHLDWSFLDGDDGHLPVAVPKGPAPKPLAPAGAGVALEFAAMATKASGDALFDRAAPHFDVLLPAR